MIKEGENRGIRPPPVFKVYQIQFLINKPFKVMKKKRIRQNLCRGCMPKFLLKMKLLSFFILVSAITTLAANSYSQQTKFNISFRSATVREVLQKIEDSSEFIFLYSEKSVDVDRKVDVNVTNQTVDVVLDQLFNGTRNFYEIRNRQISILEKGSTENSYLKIGTESSQQPKSISGKVTDSSGGSLPGVSVVVKGTTTGVITDMDGKYTLSNIPENSILQFSFVGMKTQEVMVSGKTTINMTLIEETIGIEEVVAIGYGTQKKVSLTGSVGSIKGDAMTERPVSNLQQALQGQLPGVTVTDLGGAPGKSNTTIRVRGLTTLGNNNPLIIVDGLEQRLSDINPNDIESISVLKDASSTAIYGSRAANGVMLITTKRAKSGKVSVAYNGFYALEKAINIPQHMGLEDYMHMMNVGDKNAGISPRYTEAYISEYVNAKDRYKYPLPNTWFQTVFSVAPHQSHSLSVSGGSEHIKTRASLRYENQDAIVPNSGSDIKEVRINNDFKVSNKINLITDLNYRSSSYTSLVNDNNIYENIYNRMLHSSLWAVPKYPDGTYGLSPQGHNPLMYAEIGGTSKTIDDYVVGSVKGDWEILKGLKFSTQLAAQIENSATKAFANSYVVRDYYNPTIIKKTVSPNRLDELRSMEREFTINNLLNYSTTIGKHTLNILAGYSQIEHSSNYISAYRQQFYNNDIQSLGQGANDNTKSNGGYDAEWGLRSYFGRINYSFAEKYYFEGNSRYDGSSRFAEKHRYGFYPSFSAGWRLSKETFWKYLDKYVNELKLRGSWGKTGNQAVELYSYFPVLNSVTYTFGGNSAQGYVQQKMADPNLTWETTTQANVGLDAQFLNNKFSLIIDYYRKRTDGILLLLPVPGTFGLTASPQNAGVVDNNGWEISMETRNKWGRLGFIANANININNNKVISLAETGPYLNGSNIDPLFITAEGYAINSFWGYETDGLFQSEEEIRNYPTLVGGTKPGDVKYVDRNNDGVINADDMTYMGDSFPKYTFGGNINLSYRNFSLNLLFQGAADVKTRIAGALVEMGANNAFTHKIYTNNYWTPENTNARFPRPITSDIRNFNSSDRMMINATYLRLKNIQLMYQLPTSLTQKFHIEKVNVYVSSTNLLTFSKLNEWNLDPETPPGRANYYPQIGSTALGININF
ncbi:TonB-dependent receptor [Aquipluma nitroreducens]|uniref:TonB-dependent receptor n=1 Tax=Aquipluma nitroreducens TaxID=2010828 RepID=A0A5K7S441_9BACT|nr:TonB-dependent receptor [Aquipluma nitroreducens]BBE16338.1 TonB-dependent receptor [Aquipluma nitroreducens]